MNTERKRQFIINVAYVATIALIIVLLFRYVIVQIMPFLIGFSLAYILKRPIQFVNKNFKIKYNVAAIIITILFYAIVSSLLFLLGAGIWAGVQDLIVEIPNLYEEYAAHIVADTTENIKDIVGKLNAGASDEVASLIESATTELTGAIGQGISKVSSLVIGGVSNFATSIPGMFIKLVLMIISTFFAAIDYPKIMSFIQAQLNPRVVSLVGEIKGYAVGTLWVCIRSYTLIMTITFIELSIGLSVIGIENGILIALCISIFDILPVLGTGGIMIPWGIINLVSGNIGLGIKLLIIYVIITVIRNILEPKIVGGQLGLHPLVTLSSMFIGVNLLGVVGLFGFPILISLLVYLNNKGTISILKDPNGEFSSIKDTKANEVEIKTDK